MFAGARCLIAALALLALSSPAGAKSLTGPEITAAIADRTVEGDGWRRIFRADGSTTYTSSRGPESGSWEARQGKYCSMWPPPETWACYEVALDGETINFISDSGEEYKGRLLPP